MRASAHIAWFVVAILHCVTLAADERIPAAPPGTTAEPKSTDQIDNSGSEAWWESAPLASDSPPASSESLDMVTPSVLEKLDAMEPEKRNATLLGLASAMLEHQDFERGEAILRLLAEDGYAPAQARLGVMYDSGEGRPVDHGEAARWYRLAADQGMPAAQYNLGLKHHKGEGVPQSYQDAMRWFRLAADQGDELAQYNLGVMYGDGQGAPQDYQEAIFWYRLAAHQGHDAAMHNLGYMYSQGRGVVQDYVQAHMWFNLAAAQGDPFSVKNRDGLARKMTSAQLAEAQRLAREWTPNGWDVVSETDLPQEPKLAGSGTGFFISPKGHVLTNHHVVDGCREVHTGTSAEGYQTARILAANARSDLAILQTGNVSKKPARFRVNPSVRQGENSAVFGFPLAGALSSTGNLTTGNITALAGLDDDPGFFQISTPVQPGNSGGPLLDMSGAVVGVVVSKLDAIKVASAIQDIPQNVNFAIKGSVVLNLLESRGIPYESAAATATRSAADVADIARGFTVQVLCYQ